MDAYVSKEASKSIWFQATKRYILISKLISLHDWRFYLIWFFDRSVHLSIAKSQACDVAEPVQKHASINGRVFVLVYAEILCVGERHTYPCSKADIHTRARSHNHRYAHVHTNQEADLVCANSSFYPTNKIDREALHFTDTNTRATSHTQHRKHQSRSKIDFWRKTIRAERNDAQDCSFAAHFFALWCICL